MGGGEGGGGGGRQTQVQPSSTLTALVSQRANTCDLENNGPAAPGLIWWEARPERQLGWSQPELHVETGVCDPCWRRLC